MHTYFMPTKCELKCILATERRYKAPKVMTIGGKYSFNPAQIQGQWEYTCKKNGG